MGGDGIANNWKELSGENNWEGLLTPLEINLRRYIIHYGERAQVTNDAFNDQKTSEMYGFPLYAPEKLFSKVGLQNGNPYKYSVTNYFYATPDPDFSGWDVTPGQSAWIGYVAVATDEGKAMLGRRDILISWRGTKTDQEWDHNGKFLLTSASDILGNAVHDPKVHRGFHALYITSYSVSRFNKSSAREQVLSAVRAVVDKYKDEEISITITGHSLGAALATLNAADLVANGYNKPTGSDTTCKVTAIVFASPRIGNSGFKTAFEELDNLHLLRITDVNDLIPTLPPTFLGYVDLGKELKIDTTKSPYLKTDLSSSIVIGYSHLLENYLHGVAGTQGDDEFQLAVDRDIALVNKEIDYLKTEYGVPQNWWTMENKNMVQMDNGFWKLDDYVPDPPSLTPI